MDLLKKVFHLYTADYTMLPQLPSVDASQWFGAKEFISSAIAAEQAKAAALAEMVPPRP